MASNTAQIILVGVLMATLCEAAYLPVKPRQSVQAFENENEFPNLKEDNISKNHMGEEDKCLKVFIMFLDGTTLTAGSLNDSNSNYRRVDFSWGDGEDAQWNVEYVDDAQDVLKLKNVAYDMYLIASDPVNSQGERRALAANEEVIDSDTLSNWRFEPASADKSYVKHVNTNLFLHKGLLGFALLLPQQNNDNLRVVCVWDST